MKRLSIPLKTMFALLVISLLVACAPGEEPPSPEEIQAAINTAVAMTMEAEAQIATTVAMTVAARETEAAATAAAATPPLDTTSHSLRRFLGELQRVADDVGNAVIDFRRLVIMRQDDGRGIAMQRLLDDFPRVNGRVVDRAAEQLVKRQHAVAVVQEHAAEHLMGPVPQPCQQETGAVGRRSYVSAGR